MLNKPIFKTTAIALSAAMLATTALPVTTASAHERRVVHNHYYGAPGKTVRKHRKHVRHNHRRAKRKIVRHHNYDRRKRDRGDLIAAGIVGVAVGAIIAGSAAKQRNQPNYSSSYDARRVPLNNYNGGYVAPRGTDVVRYNAPTVSYEPWTADWYRWCDARYRSFNPDRGTYRGYDGQDHFCVVK